MSRIFGLGAVFSLLVWAGVAVSQPTASVDESSSDSSTEDSTGYKFDSARFAAAMDQASGTPGEGSANLDSHETPFGSLGALLSRTLVSLAVIVGLIYAFGQVMRKLGGRSFDSSHGPLRVLLKRPLSQKSNLYVVSALDRYLIIGETAQGLTCLSELSDPEENRRLAEKWDWEVSQPGHRENLFAPGTSPFAPKLRSQVEEIERELEGYQEVGR